MTQLRRPPTRGQPSLTPELGFFWRQLFTNVGHYSITTCPADVPLVPPCACRMPCMGTGKIGLRGAGGGGGGH